MAQSKTNRRSEDPKSEASTGALEVLNAELCTLPAQRFKEESVVTDVYIRGNLCERTKKLKSSQKTKKTEFQVELTAIYSLKFLSSPLKSSDLKLFRSKQSFH